MTSISIIPRFGRLKQVGQHALPALTRASWSQERPSLQDWAEHPGCLPHFVQQSPVAMRYLQLLGPLAWDQLPERDVYPLWVPQPISYAAFTAACLVKLDRQLVSMGGLRRYLVEHPELVWLFGFPLAASDDFLWGFNADASLPTQRHFTRMLRTIPNPLLQFLLDSSVALLQAELAELDIRLGECIAVDTKHILAWVKENNPKAYIKGKRYDKTQQPKGDPDCRLGCKRRHNQRASSKDAPPTPADNPLPADTLSVGEYYWGYASGVVAAKVPGWGEFVMAELTQPFDQPDVSYFFPLMADVERRLGSRPKFGAFDAAFDAFYVYEYFHQAGQDGFAAVPFRNAADTKLASSAPTAHPSARPDCRWRSSIPSSIALAFWSTSANATSVHCAIPNLPDRLAPRTIPGGPRVAVLRRWPPASGRAYATRSTVRAKPTKRCTNSAPLLSASTAKPSTWASSAPSCVMGRLSLT